MRDINFKGLREQLRKFTENGFAKGTHWSIANGGYDLWWQISYDSIPVVDCVDGELCNNGVISSSVFIRICKIIQEEFRRRYEIENEGE